MMRKTFYIIYIALLFIGCEDVIEVDVPQTPPQLSIDALKAYMGGTLGMGDGSKVSEARCPRQNALGRI